MILPTMPKDTSTSTWFRNQDIQITRPLSHRASILNCKINKKIQISSSGSIRGLGAQPPLISSFPIFPLSINELKRGTYREWMEELPATLLTSPPQAPACLRIPQSNFKEQRLRISQQTKMVKKTIKHI